MLNAFAHIPRRYQSPAVVTAGVEINALIESCRDFNDLHRNADRQAQQQREATRRILEAFPTGTPVQDKHRELAGAIIKLAVNAAPQERLIEQDAATAGMRLAATALALDFYAERPELLRHAIAVTTPDETEAAAGPPAGPEVALLCGEYAITTLFPYFQPLDSPERFRRLFRELPAPLIFAGLGHINALEVQKRAPADNPRPVQEAMALAASIWLAAGALTAADPQLTAGAGCPQAAAE